jgi:hypothetical protein
MITKNERRNEDGLLARDNPEGVVDYTSWVVRGAHCLDCMSGSLVVLDDATNPSPRRPLCWLCDMKQATNNI